MSYKIIFILSLKSQKKMARKSWNELEGYISYLHFRLFNPWKVRKKFYIFILTFFWKLFWKYFFFFTKNWYEIRVIIKMCLSSHQILLHICYKMITPAYCIDIYTCNKHIKINRARIPPSPNLIFIILNQTLKISTIIKKIFLYHF